VLRRVWSLPTGKVAIGILLFVVLLAVFGGTLAPQDPLGNPDATGGAHLAGVSAHHWLGTDYLGRDVLSRLLAGSRASVEGALEVAVLALAIGAVPGILSVYLGRVFEWATLRLVDTLISLPFLLVAVAVTSLIGNSLTPALLVVGVLLAPNAYRVARAATLSVARSQYVEAAEISGASLGWIIPRHVWAKVVPPIAVSLAYTLGVGFGVVATLSFLGVGVQPPAPTWGGMLASDLNYLSYQPWAPIAPIVLIVAAVMACHLLADAIRDVSGEAGRVMLKSRFAKARRLVLPLGGV
jgi:peptide/nickel transport system permease protein